MDKSEARIQMEIVMWFRSHHNRTGLMFAVPNETSNVKELMAKKATGLLPGVSDLVVLLEGGRVLFVEVKTLTNKQQPNQIKFQDNCERLGFNYFVVRSLNEFKEILGN